MPNRYKALVAKFTQHPDFKKQLLETENAWLIEHTANDRQWADGGDGTGTNFLGKLLMVIRFKFQNETRLKECGMTMDEIKPFPQSFFSAPMTDLLNY